ncbi:MAG TPA: Tm-1-like ATP-binding domain-containing protein [Longimicrobiales bacterium]|nr:Tm-1-like ATP-binding domain-containing protein [Longimicrobiales bacterium]
MARTVLLLGTLDTKGSELAYVRTCVEAHGLETLVVDAGVLGEPAFEPDVGADEVARAGGGSLTELRERADRGTAVDVMIAGLEQVVRSLHAEGRVDGALGVGGGGRTALATSAMRTLPVGVPKVMVSTMASGDVSPYVGIRDLTLMYSVTDIAGLNPLTRTILANAAGAVAGMVAQDPPPAPAERPMVAASMFGVTTPCVDRVRDLLDEAGYEVVVFHATGSGGRALESLVEEGWFVGVADVTTTEWCDEVVGGVLSAGPDRLSAAGRAGIPQVVSVGATDMVNFGGMDTVPEAFRDRTLYKHNPSVTLMRTTPEECREVGRRIAERLNAAEGPTVVMLPLRGVSMIDAAGQPFHDPEADAALFAALRQGLRDGIEVVEVDAHVNDPGFADAFAERMLRLLEAHDPAAPAS